MGSTYITCTEEFIELLQQNKKAIEKLLDNEGRGLTFIKEIADLHMISNNIDQKLEIFKQDTIRREDRYQQALTKILIEIEKLKMKDKNE